MRDHKIKESAAELLRNKDKVFRLLDYLRPEDIERGALILPDEIINQELRSYITNRAAPYLINYRLTSTASASGMDGPGGLLFLDLELQIKQLGRVQARYMITISELTFSPQVRRLSFDYREDIRCGNPLQSIALKALLGDKTLLMKAAERAGLSETADRQSAVVDLTRFPSLALPKFIDNATLRYDGAGEGFLCFRFAFQ